MIATKSVPLLMPNRKQLYSSNDAELIAIRSAGTSRSVSGVGELAEMAVWSDPPSH